MADSQARCHKLIWLYPLTYLLHVGEELFVGGGFPGWWETLTGISLSRQQFFLHNSVGWALMLVGVMLICWRAKFRWIEVSYAVAILLNAAFHIAASMWTLTYSPGLITSIALWFPLAAATLMRRSSTLNRRAFRRSVIVGLFIHLIVLALIFIPL
ncbi:hypothetical protein BH18ACI2_BH18ACI2_05210 [soil metagenome]